jgi:hypothetical protein
VPFCVSLIGGIASAHNFASPEGTPPLRVLQIVPELETGGAELTTVDVAQALVDSGHEAFVVSQGGRMVADLPEAATHITLPVASKNPLTMLANARRIRACASGSVLTSSMLAVVPRPGQV